MSFFMINIDTEAWTPNQFEVEADTSGKALYRVLQELNALETERVLHSIHIGPTSADPTSDATMESWPVEDHFKRLS